MTEQTGLHVKNVWDELYENRILFLGQEVDDAIANELSAKMIALEAKDSESPVWLYINSPGGSITAGMAIYDTMKAIKPPVYTVTRGMAASMGQFLLSSGEPGYRFLFPHARVLMHQPSGGIGGKESDVRIEAELIKSMKRQMAELTAVQTGHTVEEIYQDNEYDHWYTSGEALAYGFVDHIVSTNEEMLAIVQNNGKEPVKTKSKTKTRTRKTTTRHSKEQDNE